MARAIVVAGAAVFLAASARDAALNGADAGALQQRLADAGCYHGVIDGRPGVAVETARKACPDQSPMLRIESGMHISQLSNIAVDARCTLAATGSDDKTVRLWSMPDGKLLRVQRLPIDGEAGGKIKTVAVSPDGAWIAASVDDAHVALDGETRPLSLRRGDRRYGSADRRDRRRLPDGPRVLGPTANVWPPRPTGAGCGFSTSRPARSSCAINPRRGAATMASPMAPAARCSRSANSVGSPATTPI